MYRIAYFILGLWSVLIYTPQSSAQYFDVGAGVGAAAYYGDLTPKGRPLAELRGLVTLAARYNLSPYFNLKATLSHGRLAGDDKNSLTGTGRLQRNLHFRTPISELAILSEFSILPYIPGDRQRPHPVAPYGFVGIAIFNFNPQAEYEGRWVNLQGLSTEGQGLPGYEGTSPYALTQISIPFGGGVRIGLSEYFNLNIEIGARKTFTDYLDDVSTNYADPQILKTYKGDLAATLANRSRTADGQVAARTGDQRGSPKVKDWYIFTSVGLSYNFHYRYPFPDKSRKRSGRRVGRGKKHRLRF